MAVPIPEKVVAEVVAEASGKMKDPNYAAGLVDTWVRTQPDATQYVTAHVGELGGTEAVVSTLFHACLVEKCFQRQVGRSVPRLTFADLDHVADGERPERLKKRQPALFDFLSVNIEKEAMRDVLILLALGMDLVS